MKNRFVLAALGFAVTLVPSLAAAQVTPGRLRARAVACAQQYEALARERRPTRRPGSARPIGSSTGARSDGFEFVIFDADTRQKQPAFDHHAARRGAVEGLGQGVQAGTALPFQTFTFNDALSAIEMTIAGARWTCTLADYACRTPEPPPPGEIRRGITGPVRGDHVGASCRGRGCRPTASGWRSSTTTTWRSARSAATSASLLSTDGSEGNYYDARVDRVVARFDEARGVSRAPGYRRLVHYVASSPEDQLQPRALGDAVRQARRPARPRAAGAVRRAQPEADRHRPAALPQSLRPVRPGVAQGQPRA